MKEINDSMDLETLEYPKAQDITDITKTPEEYHAEQKHQLLIGLFTDISTAATRGRNEYQAPFFIDGTDPRFPNEVEQVLKGLGYEVSREILDAKQGKADVLTISWDRPEVAETTES